MDKKVVAIIGAKGMLGYDLGRVFKKDKNYKIYPFDVDSLDITKYRETESTLKDLNPDYILNSAAFTAVDDCEDKKHIKACFAVNTKGPENLAKIAKKIGSTLIHVSTDYVFNGKKKEGYTERSRVNPINQYGVSKAEGEAAIKSELSKFYIVRTSWLYGKNGKNFVKTMLELSKKFPELKVVDDQRGKPTWTYDLAVHIKALIESGKPFGVYHFANEGETTWYRFTKEILKQAKIDTPVKPCTSEEFPRPAARPEVSTLLNMKFKRMRHWKRALGEYLKDSKVI